MIRARTPVKLNPGKLLPHDRDVAEKVSDQPVKARVLSGPVPYADAMALQEDLVIRRLADAEPDTLLLLEHAPVITMGVSSRASNLLQSPERLASWGVEVTDSARGGDITYHGPGQLVAYPVLKLRADERDVRGYVRRLEETAIRTAAAFGVPARRRAGKTGVWTSRGKLAAIGIRIRRWVTFHGVSFNVAPEPDGFKWIVPCGLAGEPVASLRALLFPEPPPEIEVVQDVFLKAFAAVFERRIEIDPDNAAGSGKRAKRCGARRRPA